MNKDLPHSLVGCPVCKLGYPNREMGKHIRDEHPGKYFSCPYCTFWSAEPEALKDHLKEKHINEMIATVLLIDGLQKEEFEDG